MTDRYSGIPSSISPHCHSAEHSCVAIQTVVETSVHLRIGAKSKVLLYLKSPFCRADANRRASENARRELLVGRVDLRSRRLGGLYSATCAGLVESRGRVCEVTGRYQYSYWPAFALCLLVLSLAK